MAMSRAHQPESLNNNGSSLFTIEEIDVRIQQILTENSELRNTLQQNNTYMRLLISTLTEWHDEIGRIHGSYQTNCEKARKIIAQMESENQILKQKLHLAIAKGFYPKEDLSTTLAIHDLPEIMGSFEIVDNKSCIFIANNLDHHNNSNLKKQYLELSTEVISETATKEVLQDLSNLSDFGENHHHERLLTNPNQQISRPCGSAIEQKEEMYHSVTKSNKNTSQHHHLKFLELEKNNDVLNLQCRELTEKISSLNARLSVAEELVLSKQTQNTELLMEVSRLEKYVEVIPILKAQLDVYQSDFGAEREARQNLAGEKEALALELRVLKRKLEELRVNPSSSQMNFENLQSYECPKCSFKYSTFESLNNHLDECLNQQMFPI